VDPNPRRPAGAGALRQPRLGFRKCDDCPDLAACALREALLRARDATADVLEAYSLADAAASGAPEILRSAS
jgi:DNA-binding IscR family transcriptional regulator